MNPTAQRAEPADGVEDGFGAGKCHHQLGDLAGHGVHAPGVRFEVALVHESRTISKTITVNWRPSLQEPLPWAADAVVGAITWWIDGQGAGFEYLEDHVKVMCID